MARRRPASPTPAAGERRAARTTPSPQADVAGLRIIGGTLRGRKIAYSGDPRTRPMKDRVREATFNLIGPDVVGTHALDLFAGTGALGIEALSRGAVGATFFEKHFPTADLLRQALRELALEDRAQVVACDTLVQVRRMRRDGSNLPTDRRWSVFCSPPYELYVARREAMLQLIDDMLAMSPPQSMLAVEADARFDFASLPEADRWRVREYLPAVVGLYRKS